MTKRQRILREIAEAYLTPYKKRMKLQKHITRHGLCWAYQEMDDGNENAYVWFGKILGSDTNHFIIPRFRYTSDKIQLKGFNPGNDTIRATAALFFAAMSNAEFKELLK